MVYTPDKWTVIRIEGKDTPLCYKVFACWRGGYLDGDSWKLNSGIKSVTYGGDAYYFKGYSGSIYKCYKGVYGTHNYGLGILNDIIERSEHNEVKVKILPEDTNWVDLSY